MHGQPCAHRLVAQLHAVLIAVLIVMQKLRSLKVIRDARYCTPVRTHASVDAELAAAERLSERHATVRQCVHMRPWTTELAVAEGLSLKGCQRGHVRPHASVDNRTCGR